MLCLECGREGAWAGAQMWERCLVRHSEALGVIVGRGSVRGSACSGGTYVRPVERRTPARKAETARVQGQPRVTELLSVWPT